MCRAATHSLSTKRRFSATINSMTATVEHIRKQIDNLAPDEARELLLDLQRSFSVPLVPSEYSDDDAEVEASWDAEIDARIKGIEDGKVKLVSGEEFERNTAALFEELGIPRRA